jgi:hypothetical protein
MENPLPTGAKKHNLNWRTDLLMIGAVAVLAGLLYLALIRWWPAGSTVTGAAPSYLTSQVGATQVVSRVEPAPPLSELAAKKKSMTDAQWDSYADTLKGEYISGWTGKVQSVDQKPLSDVYRMTVDLDDPVPGYAFDLYVDLNKDEALAVNKDATVSVSGNIRSIDCMLTLCPIELDHAAFTMR